jgi:hypothetical protein
MLSNHTPPLLVVSDREVPEGGPQLPDEPLAQLSQIPTHADDW